MRQSSARCFSFDWRLTLINNVTGVQRWREGTVSVADWIQTKAKVLSVSTYSKARIIRECLHTVVKTLIESNRVQRHVGRLSHLTTVGLMLIHTQTWRGKDYCRLLEYLLKKLFKDGIIQNIQQYLSALCKSLTSALLFVVLCVSPPSLPFYLFTGEATNKDLSRTFAN